MQTNSAIVQQAAASSEELSAQAESLKNMVGRFKLKEKEKKETVEKKVLNNKVNQFVSETKILLNDMEFGKYK